MGFWEKIRYKLTEYNKDNFYYKLCIGVIFVILCMIRYLNKYQFNYIFFFHLQQGRIVLLLVLVMLCCIFKCRIRSKKRRRILSITLWVCAGLKWFVFSETAWPVYITSPEGTNTFVIIEEMTGSEKGHPVFYSKEKFGYGFVFFCPLYGMEFKTHFSQWNYSYKWLSEDKLEMIISEGWRQLEYSNARLEFDFNNKNDISVYSGDIYIPKTDFMEEEKE